MRLIQISIGYLLLSACTTHIFGGIITNYTDSMISVDSFTDESGFYSYTFTGGTSSEIFWGFSDRLGLINIQSYGLESVVDPTGWESTVNPSGLITWSYNSDTWHMRDSPVTFAYQSSIDQYAMYPEAGNIAASVYDSDYNGGNIVGVQTFDHLAPVPEPSTVLLYILGAALLGTIRKMRSLKTCNH